jgi:hypothetical protein
VGLWADTNNYDFLIEGNWVEANDRQGIFYEISYNAAIRYNVIRANVLTKGAQRIAAGNNFPDAAIYISESGGDVRVPHRMLGRPIIEVAHNLIEDNYNGITLWENPNRFCNSPENTSVGYCTIVNPAVTLESCNATNIAFAPHINDCRWKTQNVLVSHNDFRMNPANVMNCSTTYCGHISLLSMDGTSPSWSPYMGDAVKNAIVFQQRNEFRENRYKGAWSFMPLDTRRLIDFTAWQQSPYLQEVGSYFNSVANRDLVSD